MTPKRRKKMKKRARGGASHPCPKCGKPSHVMVTRRSGEGRVVRTRICLGCDNVFRTEEAHAEKPAA